MFLRQKLCNLLKFSSQTIKKTSISTNNSGLQKNIQKSSVGGSRAIAYQIPRQWSIPHLYNLLDPSKSSISLIQPILTKLGQPSGKYLFHFKTVQKMQKYILQYNEDFIQTQQSVHKVVLKQFRKDKIQRKAIQQSINKKFGVKMTSLDFDIDIHQITRLAQDFGQIQYIDLPLKANKTLNMGYSFVYFKNKVSMQQFASFINGLNYKDRKLKATVIKTQTELQRPKQIQQIQAPKIVMKHNQELFRKLVKQQAISNNKTII